MILTSRGHNIGNCLVFVRSPAKIKTAHRDVYRMFRINLGIVGEGARESEEEGLRIHEFISHRTHNPRNTPMNESENALCALGTSPV